jgi:hypothetical protein
MFFPVSGALNKMPAETWRQYAPLFNEYSTATITPELLAALAQVESAGNPVARTYWRWRLTWHPFEIYQPASSAVGMYQLTDAAFADARHYCIRHHTVGRRRSVFQSRPIRVFRDDFPAAPDDDVAVAEVMRGRARDSRRRRLDV